MQANKASSLSGLEQLPSELQQMILSCVQDVYSLRSAVLSCRSLYSSFMSAERPIATRVLLEQIHPSILQDVMARYESLSVESLNYKMVRDFIEKNYDSEKPVPIRQRDLRSALVITNFHRIISYYTETFVRETGSCFPAQDISPFQETMPASQSELCRIQRSLYRYEVFCNIFRTGSHPWRGLERERLQYDERQAMTLEDLFLSKFSPWENEQLACAYSLLAKMAAPPFTEVVAHELGWASPEVCWGSPQNIEGSSPFQRFAAEGLKRVGQLIFADTYAKRLKILSPHPSARLYFLKNAFRRINGWRFRGEGPASDDISAAGYISYLGSFTAEEEKTYVRPPFIQDPDPGPAQIWRWAYNIMNAHNLVDEPSHRSLRDWGYVMWDIARIDKSAVMAERFDWSRHRWDGQHEPSDAEMKRSISRRREIYEKGGRGWWSEDDESHVVWLWGKR